MRAHPSALVSHYFFIVSYYIFMKELAKQIRAVANERRLKIIRMLLRGSLTVSDMARQLKLSFRSTSRHLQVMKQAGYLDTEQVGLSVFYRLRRDHPIYRCLVNEISKK